MLCIENEEKKGFLKKVWTYISEDCWWRLQDFWKNYVWPAYHIRNFFFYRYDMVKMPQIKRYEYSDVVERVLWANVELLKFFIEKERPEEIVVWYGENGPRYGTVKEMRTYFPEFVGEYVMDLMKKSYSWFTKDRVEMNKEKEYLLDVWYNWLSGKSYFVKCEDNPEFDVMKTDRSCIPTELSFFNDKNLNWNILDKYLDGDRENLLKENFIFNKHRDLEFKMDELDQKYLHLIIECRFYLWT